MGSIASKCIYYSSIICNNRMDLHSFPCILSLMLPVPVLVESNPRTKYSPLTPMLISTDFSSKNIQIP